MIGTKVSVVKHSKDTYDVISVKLVGVYTDINSDNVMSIRTLLNLVTYNPEIAMMPESFDGYCVFFAYPTIRSSKIESEYTCKYCQALLANFNKDSEQTISYNEDFPLKRVCHINFTGFSAWKEKFLQENPIPVTLGSSLHLKEITPK